MLSRVSAHGVVLYVQGSVPRHPKLELQKAIFQRLDTLTLPHGVGG